MTIRFEAFQSDALKVLPQIHCSFLVLWTESEFLVFLMLCAKRERLGKTLLYQTLRQSSIQFFSQEDF